MHYLIALSHIILHLDSYLLELVANYGVLIYALLTLIIFCESAFVFAPFLPGDSLLFAIGSVTAQSYTHLNPILFFLLLVTASITGNQLNYLIGKIVGDRAFTRNNTWFININYLKRTQLFYAKHGGKTIFLARFIPIIRTFAPFVAGMGCMQMRTFLFYNLISAIFWIGSLFGCGYFFGEIPIIKANFTLIIYAIIAISLLPPLCVFLYRKLTTDNTYKTSEG